MRVVEHRGRRFEAHVHFDGIAGCGFHRAQRRGHKAGDGSFAGEPIGEGDERGSLAPIGHDNGDSTCANAAVAGSGEQ